MNLWKKISTFGVSDDISVTERRKSVLLNQTSFFLIGVTGFVLAYALRLEYYANALTMMLLIAGFVMIFLLNKVGKYNIAAIIISLIIPFFIIGNSLIAKLMYETASEVVMYFVPKIVLISLFVIPFVLMEVGKKPFIIVISVYFIFSLGYDVIHELSGVGIENAVLSTDLFYFSTISTAVSLIIIVVGLSFLQNMNKTIEKDLHIKNAKINTALKLADKSHEKLRIKNIELNALYKNVDTQFEIIKENEEKYRLLFEKSKDAILLLNENQIVDCNHSAIKMFKTEQKSDLLNKNPSDLSPATQIHTSSDVLANKMIAEAYQEGTNNFEWRHKTCSGTIFPAEIILTAIPYQEKKIIHAVVRDLTDRKNAEQKIKDQYEELQTTEEELRQNNDELLILKDKAEKANQEISESIAYARLIQKGLLTQNETLDKLLNDYFLFYRPMDEVGGDFYYVNKIDGKLIVAVADCTGHGVAGGFLTMLGITYIHDTMRKDAEQSPAKVLEVLRKRFKRSFRNFGRKSHLGLEIALCIIDERTNELRYSGSFNPLYIFRDGELGELKATRNPIGFYPVEQPFTEKTVTLYKDDMLYLFSDGYKDQIGGAFNRKFRTVKFKSLLKDISRLQVAEQKQILEHTIYDWLGENSQIDDITVMGFKWG